MRYTLFGFVLSLFMLTSEISYATDLNKEEAPQVKALKHDHR